MDREYRAGVKKGVGAKKGGDEQAAKTVRGEERFLDLAGRRLNNGKA